MHRICTEEKVIHIQGHPVRLQKKNMKSLRLRLIPPHGEIRISVPSWYSDKKAAQFVLSRWEWIQEQQRTIQAVHPLTQQRYLDGSSLLFQGRSYRICIQTAARSSVPLLAGDCIILKEKEGTGEDQRKKKIETWYRKQMMLIMEPLIIHWSDLMKVQPLEWKIKKMNTRWGSCNTSSCRIWLNLELITMKPEILEYVLVHELTHLLERCHNKRFKALLDQFLPTWRGLSRELRGGLPL
ncbi:M48 family metallopeptidase [Oceanispirochaeta sp.]|jgi:predicted metal-dependent hydrolase|uniref:M48 family metallopeptidase n=1 Tax=Oceanispirochaeta sp. TaxID=2035350 RepID=UPI00260EA6C9|nr:SprT family zinc-dependent metalloprotease [Oceanispirochaeta sp.]MDA3955288.1 SprT family zinc-dependent metalloprotease [Oceanispirochaeta sp.]